MPATTSRFVAALAVVSLGTMWPGAGTAEAMSLCNNSLFINPSAWGAVTSKGGWMKNGLPSHASPVPPPAALSKTCQAYAKKKEVCCSNDTIHAIESANVVAQAAIAAAEKSIESGTSFSKSIVKIVSGAISSICDLNSPPFAKICNTLMATINKYTQRINDDIKRIATDQTQCASAIATYAEGMACFACEVEFNSYLDLEKKVIRLASSTCDVVYDRCAASIQNDVNALLRTVTDFTNELTSELQGGNSPVPGFKPPVLPDMCGGTYASPGDCRKFVCKQILNGFDSRQWLDWSNWMTEMEEIAAIQQRRLASDDAIVSLSGVSELVANAAEQSQSQWRSQWRHLLNDINSVSTGEFNEYSTDGYDAFGVGCRDLKTCPGNPWWLYALVCVGAVAIAGFIAFFVSKRSKEISRRRNQANLSGPDSSSYGAI